MRDYYFLIVIYYLQGIDKYDLKIAVFENGIISSIWLFHSLDFNSQAVKA